MADTDINTSDPDRKVVKRIGNIILAPQRFVLRGFLHVLDCLMINIISINFSL